LQTQNSRVSDAPMKKKTNSTGDLKPITRRNFLKGTAAGAATLAIPVGTSDAAVWQSFFQQHSVLIITAIIAFFVIVLALLNKYLKNNNHLEGT